MKEIFSSLTAGGVAPNVAAARALEAATREQQQAKVQAEANEALQRMHAERRARQEQATEERARAEAAARAQLREAEEERRRAVARERKEKRKQKKATAAAGDAVEGGDELDDVDAALAALGLDSSGNGDAGGGATSAANPQGGALPWGRDRDAERERERLRTTLHAKIAGGGSHKKSQPNSKGGARKK